MNFTPKGLWTAGTRLAVALVGSCVAIVAICQLLYVHEAGLVVQRLKDAETVRVDSVAQFARTDLRPVGTDLRSLAEGDGLHAYLASGSRADLERAIHRAVFYSRQQNDYDQIRYLDERGHEVFRVSQGGVVAPESQLQDHSTINYFLRTKTMLPGQIFVSTFALSADAGRVELPAKPILRFATPIFDQQGRHRGVYVISYAGKELLYQLARGSAAALRLRLLNAQGYWLRGAASANEWGFMYPDRKGFTLAQTDPEAWRRLASANEGQLTLHGGIFTWQRVRLQDLVGRSSAEVVAEEPFWIIASEVSAPELTDRLSGLWVIFGLATTGLLLLAVTSILFVRSRQHALLVLRRSEEDLSVILQSIGDGVIATDTSGRVTRLNAVAEQLTGWLRREARGRPIEEIFRIVNETTRAPAIIPVAQVLATGKIHGLANHTVLIARDGTEIAIADSAAPIRARDGTVLGVVLVFRDVGEERRAELRLQAARSELDRFFSLSLDFLCISGADGYFKRVSPAVADMLGWTVEEFLSRPFLEYIHPDDHVATLREVERQVARGESVFHFENRYRHKDGSWRVLSWRSVPQPDGLMYATARDVTEVKAHEEEITQLNQELRTHAGQLESANQELEAFTYSVSHDLRAPLRHVQGYVEILTTEVHNELPPKAQRYLGIIAAASSEMSQLIDDLLSFSRMGRAQMSEETIDLNLILQDVRKGLAPDPARAIRWTVAQLPQARGDTAMIKQVFVNLLSNAVKYTRAKPVAEIEVSCGDDPSGQICVTVKDNGAGFDMAYADKLFGVFQRLHRADEFEGTGIGLANVRRIVTRHGGRVWAESEVNRGATFHFTLNRAS